MAFVAFVLAAACGGGEPEAPAETLLLSVESADLEYEAISPVVQGDRYWAALVIRLDNGGDESVPLAFINFSVESNDGLSYSASEATLVEPNACAADTSVLPGASASCRLLFALRNGELPFRVVYSANERSAEADIELCGSAEAPNLCGRRCVNLETDPEHCGACDSPVPSGFACRNGSPGCEPDEFLCAGECTRNDGSFAECDGACVNVGRDPQNCGACGVVVADEEDCVAGEPTCRDTVRCGDLCVDTNTDIEHCGSCETSCPDVDLQLTHTRSCEDGTSCHLRFPTPGTPCAGPCEALGWTCYNPLEPSSCNCDFGNYDAGDCFCHCSTAPV